MELLFSSRHFKAFSSNRFKIIKTLHSHYRKRGSASYIVREVLSVRERDTER